MELLYMSMNEMMHFSKTVCLEIARSMLGSINQLNYKLLYRS